MTEGRRKETLHGLNAASAQERLGVLKELAEAESSGAIDAPGTTGYVNNHIHTIYSFSPYSPAAAVWLSREAGLAVSGIVDHDSVAGVREYREAGRILDFPTTAGFEMRLDYTSTPLGTRYMNNPDQAGIAYMTFHGLRDAEIDAVAEFLEPVHAARDERNRLMCARMSEVSGVPLDYDRDVLPLSQHASGGSVTERHLACALARKKLGDTDDIYALYDLIGGIKATLVEDFYVPAGPVECPPVADIVGFARAHDIILTYPYLGDVTESVTGDKKAQKFEDDYLDELFEVLGGLGIRAVSYMPARNTMEQLLRMHELAQRYDMLEISGEDINSPRQPFVSEQSKDPRFGNLREMTWKLVAHERGEINLV
jgi:hypothetical protein